MIIQNQEISTVIKSCEAKKEQARLAMEKSTNIRHKQSLNAQIEFLNNEISTLKSQLNNG